MHKLVEPIIVVDDILLTFESRCLGAPFSVLTVVERAGVIVKYIIGFDYKKQIINARNTYLE